MKKPTNKNKAREAPRKKNYNNIKEYKVTGKGNLRTESPVAERTDGLKMKYDA